MKPLSTAAGQMPRSGIRVILDMASRFSEVIHLEIGQPDFSTPEHIIAAALQAAQQGFTKYTPNAGLLSLREAIVEKVRRENNLSASMENVVVTTGGMGGLYSAFTALLEPGDEVLIPDPGYPNYTMVTQLCRARAIYYPLDAANGFQPCLEVLPRLVTPRTKALVVNSPSNPTGSVIPVEGMAALVAFAHEHDLYLISDECYEKIIFDARHVSPASLDNEGRVLSIFSFSKTYAMTGWRVGYAIVPQEIAAIFIKLQEATVACASSVSQKAAEAALKGPQDCVEIMVNAYRRRRDRAIAMLREHGLVTYVPQGAFYLLVDISESGWSSEEFAQNLLAHERVAVAPGRTFGPSGDRYIRISLAAREEELETGLERLCKYVNRTKG
ncbi:MAG: pyridoxal phosphate-dependent aminotransferase [Anaerolineae bacterium]|nr:pyridoxal phosphate-dependent aminotransferase [Anaerolineae bacterium]